MKKKLTIIIQLSIVLNVTITKAQGFNYLNHNNVNARLSSDGIFFNDKLNGTADYQVPANQSNSLIYASSFWFGAENSNGSTFLSAQKYGVNQDLFSGPIASDYTTPDYLSKYYDLIWTVNKSVITAHIQNYTSANYVVPSEILNWPAHGDASNGEGSNLAPFIDVNYNGIYDPENGDYPNIRGDIAKYLIFNDGAGIHTESSGNPLGIEVHFMFYQYATNDNLDNTTFINVKVINRSTHTFFNFRVGQFTDGDLGNSTDDFFGSDSLKNLIYTYNGDNNDENGYGIAPPAVGVKLLNKKMDVAGYFFADGSTGNQSDPTIAAEYWGYMNGEWKSSGIHFTEGGNGYSGTVNTNYLMSSNPNDLNGWSEQTEGSLSGDRRMFMSSEGIMLAPNDEMCYDYAVIYARGSSNLHSVDSLYQVADQIQSFYDNQAFYTCESVVLSTDNSNLKDQLKLFPNPSNGVINLEGLTIDSEIYLYSIDGKLLKVIGYNSESKFQFDVSNFKSGNYLLKIVNKEDVILKKISIK